MMPKKKTTKPAKKKLSAKKKTKKAAASAARSPSIAALRAQIDKIDRELVGLANERARLALEVGELKDSSGKDAYDPGRESEVLAHAVDANKGPLPDRCVRSVFRELISGSRSLEKRIRACYLGPEYSYTHLAAIERFGESVELVPVGSIRAVFEEVNRGQADYGVVPIENSTDGRVVDTLDMFTRLPVRICGEVQLAIHHHLLGRCRRSEVQEVYSKPQAVSQCRNWLSRHLPGARVIEVTSTSTAAQLAHDKPGVAAIASMQAGVHYGLQVLASSIEDNPENVTRFAVLGDTSAKKTRNDKTALMFGIPHRAGSLADVMAIFKRSRLNLTWIESFPIPGSDGAYLFFVEMEGHESDLRVRRAIASLEKKATRLEVLGSYAKCPPVE